jgi:lysozyme
MLLHGDDISAYQEAIPDGQDFHILKATEGLDYVDPRFAGWWQDLAGRLRGAYHFGHPANSPTAEADHFVSEVGDRLKPGDLVVLDHENLATSTRSAFTESERAAVVAAAAGVDRAWWARTWCQAVAAALGRLPIVYTYLSYAEAGYCAGLGAHPLWIADPSRAAGKPRVPSPWSTWAMHQFSTSGGIDHDVFNGTAAAFRALGGQTPPPPQEEDVYGGKLDTGNEAPTIITMPGGKFGAVGFGCDNGYQKLDPAKIRVAAHSHLGGWSQVLDEVVDSTKGKTVVTFTAHDVDMISVARLDDGRVAVSWDAS